MKINILRRWTHNQSQKAFALPTVLIASTVMLAVLTVTLASVQSGVIVALDSSHYNRYAKSAAQSGMVMAKACLRDNDYISSWPTNPLKPNTNCAGTVQAGLSAYVHEDTAEGVRSSFTINPPVEVSNGVLRITVISTAERIRQSTGAVWRTYTESSYATISVQASFSSVAFGYQKFGAFFGVISPQGSVAAVGYNGDGQLGNATTSNSTSPQPFKLPGTLRATQLYTNFLSVGYTMFAVTSDGQLYGAGLNSSGQLGNGTIASPQTTPVKFQLPAGVKAVYVSPGTSFTFVIGDDNNIYSSGGCSSGTLGYGYTMNGCTDQSTYKRVALPAVNLSDLNTLPVASSNGAQSTNITTDRTSGLVRMQGGRVYAWGRNDLGQLGNGTTLDTATPVQTTTLGNTGQPKATQIAFDGVSTWILDDTGNVWATGFNEYGALGTASPVGSSSGKCITNTGNSVTDGTQISISGCDKSASQLIEWAEDGTLKVRPNTSTVKCIDNTGGSSTNGNPIKILTCSGTSTAQKWVMNDDGKIVNPATGKCLENPGNSTTNGTGLTLNACNATVGFPAQTWPLKDISVPTKVVLPAGRGTVTRITTDQWSVLFMMSDGTVWGYGLNSAGQLGSGNLFRYNAKIQQYILPAGKTAVNFYTAKTGVETTLQYANTFVILNDGSVYGSGANTFGQLGNGTTSASQISTPIKMNLPVGIRAQTVQNGLGTTVILTDEGKIYTVGNNANGQLGDGTTTNSSTPQARQYVNNRPIVLY
jgi:alpha-tubulin suppressor-like RCC1 family protein